MAIRITRLKTAGLLLLLNVLVVPLLALSVIRAQSPSDDIPRLANGQPDIQGTWDFRTITPFQRPEDLADIDVLTEAQAAAFEDAENERRDRDNFTDTSTTGDYNQFWYDRGTEILDDGRTSLIVDPAHGRIPTLTDAARNRNQLRRDAAQEAAGVEVRPLSERCIMGFNSGPPMIPSAYNNNVQLVQTEDFVLIHNEMVHNIRPVKMNATAHLEVPRKWEGDSIGHWEGDTLIIETRNFARETAFGNSSANMQLMEKFWMIDADTLGYEFTISDPTTWEAPWTVMFPMRRTADPIYEYACHEGNYSMAGILGGWRRLEALGQTGQQ
jgi:hypothetical protein